MEGGSDRVGRGITSLAGRARGGHGLAPLLLGSCGLLVRALVVHPPQGGIITVLDGVVGAARQMLRYLKLQAEGSWIGEDSVRSGNSSPWATHTHGHLVGYGSDDAAAGNIRFRM